MMNNNNNNNNNRRTSKLNTGAELPATGLGTWQSPAQALSKQPSKPHYSEATATATPQPPTKNETEVGAGWQASGIPGNKDVKLSVDDDE
ncbi:hypothetical protein BST61_g2505 [Cercospora zeina]